MRSQRNSEEIKKFNNSLVRLNVISNDLGRKYETVEMFERKNVPRTPKNDEESIPDSVIKF